jgi:hypothetical protein
LDKSYIQPICEFQRGDVFQITINLLSERGLLDAKSLKWNSINLYDLNYDAESKTLLKNKKNSPPIEMCRICEIEMIKNSWCKYDLSNFDNKLNYNIEEFLKGLLNDMDKYFLLKTVYYDNMGFILLRIHFLAVNEGKCNLKLLGLEINVKREQITIINEVKKNGLIYDNSNFLELRKGDELILYISKNK